ncbi:MAG: Methyltransferase type 11, partial [Actinomycetia bacterium]|nr:Methyltransferase type 11 [Actinomycetes bacterium]
MADIPEHVATNRAFWDGLADKYVDAGRHNWES